MSNWTVIDTDILIDAGRGIESAVTFLERRESMMVLSVSVITAMELLVGCRDKKEQRITERFLERFATLKIDEAISDKATQLLRRYRLSHGLLIADALIAATAIAWSYPLASKNQRDYRFIEELVLLPYP